MPNDPLYLVQYNSFRHLAFSGRYARLLGDQLAQLPLITRQGCDIRGEGGTHNQHTPIHLPDLLFNSDIASHGCRSLCIARVCIVQLYGYELNIVVLDERVDRGRPLIRASMH